MQEKISKTDVKFKLYKSPYQGIIKKAKKVGKKMILPTALGTLIIFGGSVINYHNLISNVSAYDSVSVDSKNNFEMIKQERNEKVVDIKDPFLVGSKIDCVDQVNQFLYGPQGRIIYDYSEAYGIDPNLIAAMCMQETSLQHANCIPGGDFYSGYGVGMMQLECPSGQEVTAYNYNTNSYDTEYITMENACDMEKNIKIGCMLFQNSLNNNYGNPLLAIQAHNYGQGMINSIFYETYGKDGFQVKKDYQNVDWLPMIKNAHQNPNLYITGWDGEYGDGDYISHVLGNCPTDTIKYKYGTFQYTYNLKTLTVDDMIEYNTIIR